MHVTSVDLLRIYATSLVVAFHFGFSNFALGWLGVDLFFVIAGFLVSRSLSNRNVFSFADFFAFIARRLYRILPAITLMVGGVLIASPIFLPAELVRIADSIPSVLLSLGNIYFWQTLNYFDAGQFEPFLHLWSTALEMQAFALLYAFFFFTRTIPKPFLLAFIVFCVISSVGAINLFDLNERSGTYYLLVTRFWEFLIGVGFYFLFHGVALPQRSGIAAKTISFLLIAALFTYYSSSSFLKFGWAHLLFLLASAPIFIQSNSISKSSMSISLERLVLFLGRISFGVFLYHWPLIEIAKHIFDLDITNINVVLFILCQTLILSVLSYFFVEKAYFEDKSYRPAYALIPLFVGALSMSVWLNSTQGFFENYQKSDQELALLDTRNYTQYVTNAFDQRRASNLSADELKNAVILVVGDSYAQDYVNVLIAAGIDLNQIATIYSPAECGAAITFALSEGAAHDNDPDRPLWCKGYQSAALQPLKIVEPKFLVLASLWKPETQRFFESETYWLNFNKAMLKRDGSFTKTLIVDSKFFGSISPRALLRLSDHERAIRKTSAKPYLLDTKKWAPGSATSKADVFRYYANDQLPLFDERNRLVSYDGFHLTKAGAELFASERKVEIHEFFK